MTAVHLVEDPRQAAMLAAPIRQRTLEALAEHGFVELVREEERRGCKGRIVRRTAQYLEVGEAQAIAEKAGKRLPTLSTDVEIHPDGRTYRVVVGAHPIRRTRRKP